MPETIDTPDVLPPISPPPLPSRPKVLRPFWRVLVGVLVGAAVGAEFGWCVLVYYLAFVAREFRPFLVLVWEWTAGGGLIGAAVGAVGGLFWGRWARTALGTLVTAMLGGLLGFLVARYVGMLGTDPEVWLLAWVCLGGVVGGVHCWFEDKRRKRRK